MADSKRAKIGVARRNTRVFEDDIEFRQTDEYGSDTGVLYNRKRGETEQFQEKDKLAEKNIHIRRASVSSMSATNDETIGGLDKLKREKFKEEVQICQGAVVKKEPKPKIPGRPRNFALVTDGIYRSGYPEAEDHGFLKDLGLKTIVTLVDKDYPEGYQSFMQSSGISHMVIKMEGTKKVDIPESVMSTILDVVLDGQNHPLLIHCNQGRHRTGCTVAAIRRAMGWSIDSILTEYTSFAEPKVREVDIKYIQRFQDEDHIDYSTPRLERLTIVTKPRKLPKSQKMTRMVFITLLILAVFGLTYIQGRFISQAN